MPDQVSISRVFQLPSDLQTLVAESTAEGFRMIQRLSDDWQSGKNRFSLQGEALWEARGHGRLAAVCGLNQDPYAADNNIRIGRIRRLYVTKPMRRTGVARGLVERALERAREQFQTVRLRTGTPEASAFYEALGFKPVTANIEVTHEMRFG